MPTEADAGLRRLVLLLILPPIIYTSAFLMSWREFQYNLRATTLLSVGGVVFTTLAVAAAAHWLMDLEWPIGLLLGAIISPPDAIAPPGTILQRGLALTALAN